METAKSIVKETIEDRIIFTELYSSLPVKVSTSKLVKDDFYKFNFLKIFCYMGVLVQVKHTSRNQYLRIWD